MQKGLCISFIIFLSLITLYPANNKCIKTHPVHALNNSIIIKNNTNFIITIITAPESTINLVTNAIKLRQPIDQNLSFEIVKAPKNKINAINAVGAPRLIINNKVYDPIPCNPSLIKLTVEQESPSFLIRHNYTERSDVLDVIPIKNYESSH